MLIKLLTLLIGFLLGLLVAIARTIQLGPKASAWKRVPVKILRYDQNGFKDCIAAGSKATAIELPDFVHRLYMLHNGSLKVEFEYADGEKIEMDTGRGRKKPGIWCWSNPRLHSRLKAMRLASRDGKPAGRRSARNGNHCGCWIPFVRIPRDTGRLPP